MRPIKLKIQAFGPYLKPVTLDFEKNLRSERIFLINGATGAGKTTILDAICFALYGTTSGDERDGVMMRSKGISDNIKTEVEFTFALGEKIYTSYRNLVRKAEKITQNAELTCYGDVIATKKTNVTNKIKELLGFDAEQFRQVVLLPQGEFKTFLTAKADERQPILDALFNAEFYKRIVEGLEKKFKTFDDEYENLRSKREILEVQLQGTKIGDSEIEKLRVELENSRKKAAELKEIAEKAQKSLTAGEILARDFAELDKRNKSLVAAENTFKEAEKSFTSAKIEYEMRENEQKQRDKLKSDVDELEKIKNTLKELNKKRDDLAESEKQLQDATNNLKDFENKDKKYKKRLETLKQRRDELTGAEKSLAEAKNITDKANEREKIIQEIEILEKEMTTARKKIASAENLFNDANIKVNRLRELQIKGSAALLAKNLKNGEKCPVCGSKNHPELAISKEIIPSDAEIDVSQNQADKFKKNLDNVRENAAKIAGTLSSKRDELKKYAEVPEKNIAQRNFADAQKKANEFADCENRIKKGEKCIEENDSDLKKASEMQKNAEGVKNQRLGEVQTIESQIPKKYLDDSQIISAEIGKVQKNLRELENAWKIADKNYHDAGNKKASCEERYKTAQEAQKTLSDELRDKKTPEIAKLKANAEEAQKNHVTAIENVTSLKNKLENLEKISSQLAELNKKITAAEKNLRIWKKLSEVASGKIRGNKISFVRYYLRAMFAQVLTEANYRLEKMSDKRYYLKQKDAGDSKNSTAGLNMEILDEFSGETRPVATLSGGESFLASLSLALGLAAVVRNNLGGLNLDTIFIDEGFGSLDSETLDFAIKTLMELQSGGRLVGIISHVEELKKQIPVRLEVKRSETGAIAEFKHGLS